MLERIEDEAGSVLVEAMVSAIVLTIAAIGVFNALDSSSRATAQERHRAQANDIAQADVARMRTMRISDLSNLNETRQVTVEGNAYTVESKATFQTDATGTASCEEGTAAADYIQIRSIVSWPSIGAREPVEAQSLVAPPNGSVSPDSGALAIQIEGGENQGIAGVGLAGSQEGGEGSFSGSTGPNGCVVFGNLPEGNYTLEVLDSTLVDNDGNPPQPQTTSVVAEATNTLALQYDQPGTIEVGFATWIGGELVEETEFDSVVAFNTGMSVAKTFGAPGNRQPKIEATTLFPFVSPYAVYAGSCEANNPNPGGEPEPPPAIADALVSAGGVTQVTLELPALELTVWSGSEAEKGAPVEGAQVTVADTLCAEGEEGSETPVTRSFVTNEAGGLDRPGLAYSQHDEAEGEGGYDVCVEDAGGETHVSVAGLSVPADPEEIEAGTALEVFLAEGVAGPCP
jgi:Tfp pilus assembly protein PilV